MNNHSFFNQKVKFISSSVVSIVNFRHVMTFSVINAKINKESWKRTYRTGKNFKNEYRLKPNQDASTEYPTQMQIHLNFLMLAEETCGFMQPVRCLLLHVEIENMLRFSSVSLFKPSCLNWLAFNISAYLNNFPAVANKVTNPRQSNNICDGFI